MGSPFDVLRIESDADEEEIRQAYKERVKEAHPDHGGSAREFQLVRAAYRELREGDPNEGPGALQGGTVDEDGDGELNARVDYLNYEVLDDHGWDLDDDDLFEKAAAGGLDPDDCGRILVQSEESLLEAAENRGFAWPYACRGGACANCAVAVTEGDLTMPVNHILPQEMIDRGIRLSCVGEPTTDGTKVVYNVKHLPGLDELRLPPRPFEQAHSDD